MKEPKVDFDTLRLAADQPGAFDVPALLLDAAATLEAHSEYLRESGAAAANILRLLNEAAIHFESFPGGRDGDGMALLYRAIKELASTGCGVESRHAGPGDRIAVHGEAGERRASERYAVLEAGVAPGHPSTINAGGAIFKSGDREVTDQPEQSGCGGNLHQQGPVR